MKNFIRKHQSFVSYTFFGTLASGVNLIVFHILYQNIGINYVVANVISYICGMLVTFFTNKRLVFHSEYDSVKKLIREFSDCSHSFWIILSWSSVSASFLSMPTC